MQSGAWNAAQAEPAIRVLILSRDEWAVAPLADGLDRLGWRTAVTRTLMGALNLLAAHPVEAVLVEADASPAEAFAQAARLRAEGQPRRLPVLALGHLHLQSSAAFDLALPLPAHPAQAALRLEALVRASVAEEEVELRAQTFAEHGRPLARSEADHSPLRLLAIGEPAPRFLALSKVAAEAGAVVTGAFTPYTAFDYLHERAFDAVVLWAGETHAEALSIASGMRRNTRLYHIPTLLCVREGASIDPGQAFDRGLSDVLGPEVSAETAAERALSLARTCRRETVVRRALEETRASGLMDGDTGLFTRALFASHLARTAAACEARRRALSVAILRVVDRPDLAEARREGWLDRAMPQIGSMVGRLVRAHDTAARLSPDLFALLMPHATRPAAPAAAERIAAVIACTAFDAGRERGPFTIDLDVGVATLRPGEHAAAALERAAGGLIRPAG